MVTKQGIVIVADYTQQESLRVNELLACFPIDEEFIMRLISYQVIEQSSDNSEDWLFDEEAIKRIQKAIRLKKDLKINFAGIALVLDLLDEIEDLRTQTQIMERHLLR